MLPCVGLTCRVIGCRTGDMLFISYRYDANPYVSAGVLDEFGNLVRHWGVEVPYPTMMRE